MNFATIDVGSNSILLYIAEKNSRNNFTRLFDSSEITRLGEGLNKTGIISEAAMERSLNVFEYFKSLLKKYNVTGCKAVGTMALRMARNADFFIKKVKDKTGIEIEIISGDEEARLTYRGVKSGLKFGNKNTVVFDVGGGSTEFISGKEDDSVDKFSLNIGTIRFTEKYLTSDPVKSSELESADTAIEKELEKIKSFAAIESLIGTGGTVTNLASVKHKLIIYDPEIIQGATLTYDDIAKQIDFFSGMNSDERKKVTGLQPKRADVIISGALIIKNILKKCNLSSLTVSDYGLRHGLMYDKFGSEIL